MGKYREAIKNYDLALKYKPDYADAFNYKGMTLANLGKYPEAIKITI
ncbi:tetratricopeptide repeat protein [Rickettsia conorii]